MPADTVLCFALCKLYTPPSGVCSTRYLLNLNCHKVTKRDLHSSLAWRSSLLFEMDYCGAWNTLILNVPPEIFPPNKEFKVNFDWLLVEFRFKFCVELS